MMFDTEDRLGDGRPGPAAGGTTRRALFAGGGAACLALLLGACGADEQPGASTGTDKQGGGAPSAPTASTGTAVPTDEPAAPGQVLAKAAEVPAKGGVVVANVLLFRLADGSIKGYDARCPHKAIPVDPPTDTTVLCGAHKSEFKLEDGSVTKGPAKTGLKVIEVKVDGDNVVRV